MEFVDINKTLDRLNFNEEERKRTIEKFYVTLQHVDLEVLDYITNKGVDIKRGHELKALTMPLSDIKKDFDFIEAIHEAGLYVEKPLRLCLNPVDIYKRIGYCNANGIQYKDENGKYELFLFNRNLWQEVLKNRGLGEEVSSPTPAEDFNLEPFVPSDLPKEEPVLEEVAPSSESHEEEVKEEPKVIENDLYSPDVVPEIDGLKEINIGDAHHDNTLLDHSLTDIGAEPTVDEVMNEYSKVEAATTDFQSIRADLEKQLNALNDLGHDIDFSKYDDMNPSVYEAESRGR